MSDQVRDDILEKIAKGCLGVDLRKWGSHTKPLLMIDLKAALQMAYKYGKESNEPR